jgi:hypothetical protein
MLACASPTLPLPPPELPQVTSSDGHTFLLSGSCGGAEANATIVIVDTNPLLKLDQRVFGSQTDSCGAWDATITASYGDGIELTQTFGTTRSSPRTFLLQKP